MQAWQATFHDAPGHTLLLQKVKDLFSKCGQQQWSSACVAAAARHVVVPTTLGELLRWVEEGWHGHCSIQ